MVRVIPSRSRPASGVTEAVAGFAFMQLQLPATRKKVDQILQAVSPQPVVEQPMSA